MENKKVLAAAIAAVAVGGISYQLWARSKAKKGTTEEIKKSSKPCDNCDCSLSRSKENPVGNTVNLYRVHLFVHTARSDWPKHANEDDAFLDELSKAMKEKRDIIKPMVTACDLPNSSTGRDVLVFFGKGDGWRFSNVSQSEIPSLANAVVMLKTSDLEGVKALGLSAETVTKKHVFICSHENRDKRCGYYGPLLTDKFNELRVSKNIEDQVQVSKCSHIGGHVYAGNVILFGTGDWFGYVEPEHVSSLLDYLVSETAPSVEALGQTGLNKLWRGRLGLAPEEQTKYLTQWNLPFAEAKKK